MNKAIEQCRIEQQNTELLYAQLQSGDVYEPMKNSKDKDARIKEVVLLFNKLNKEVFLNRLITNLSN